MRFTKIMTMVLLCAAVCSAQSREFTTIRERMTLKFDSSAKDTAEVRGVTGATFRQLNIPAEEILSMLPPDVSMEANYHAAIEYLKSMHPGADNDEFDQILREFLPPVSEEAPVKVTYVEPGSPAQKVLMVGDRLRAIDGKAVDGQTLDAIHRLLRGEVGSSVELVFDRAGDPDHHRASVARVELHPSTLKTVNSVNFHQEVEMSNFVLIDIKADWCGPCKRMKPVLEFVQEQYEGRLKFVRIDGDDSPKLAQRIDGGIIYYPTVAIYNPKTKTATALDGYMSEDQLQDFIYEQTKLEPQLSPRVVLSLLGLLLACLLGLPAGFLCARLACKLLNTRQLPKGMTVWFVYTRSIVALCLGGVALALFAFRWSNFVLLVLCGFVLFLTVTYSLTLFFLLRRAQRKPVVEK